MPLTHRLYKNGTLATNSFFDETSYNTVKFTNTRVGAAQLDEVTFASGVTENLFPYGFTTPISGYWTPTGTTYTNVTTPLDPVGNQNVTYFQNTTTGYNAAWLQYGSYNPFPSSVTATTTIGFSIWAKYNGVRYLECIVDDSGGNGIIGNFDVLNGVVASTGVNTSGKVISSKVINYGNGWFRCFLCGTIGAKPNRVSLILSDNGASSWYPDATLTANTGIYLYGIQINTYGWPTPYWDTANSVSYLANSNSFRIDNNSNLYVINGTMDEVTIIS